jgi:hypothetical protein
MSGRPLASKRQSGLDPWGYRPAAGAEEHGTNPPLVFTNADIVSSDSGGPLVSSKEDWLGGSRNSVCIPEGENCVERFCDLLMGTSVDAVERKLFEPGCKQLPSRGFGSH